MGRPANNWGSNTYPISYNVSPATTGLGYNAGSSSRYFNGSLNEVRIENTNRAPAWIALNYANQQTNQTLVTFNSYQLSAPALSSPANGAGNLATASQTLSWGGVSGAASYTLWVSTSQSFSSGVTSYAGLTGTSQALSALSPAATYYWQVYGVAPGGTVGPGGTSNWASYYSFTTSAAAPSSAPSLSQPTNGAAVNTTLSPTLSWSALAGAYSYGLQVSTSSTSFSTTVFSQTGLTGTSQQVGPLNYTNYYWEVNATNGNGTGPWSAPWAFTVTLAPPALSAPANMADGQSVSLSLSWNSVVNASTYDVQVATSNTFASTVSDQPGLNALSAAPAGLAAGTLYYWRVSAVNGNVTAWSSVWTFTTISPWGAPTPLLPAAGAPNQSISPTLTWTAVNGAASYAVQVATITDFTTTVFSQSGLTSGLQQLSGLSNYTSYYWQVNADSSSGAITAWSPLDSFVTTIATPTLSVPSNGAINQPLTLSLSWNTVPGAATAYAVQVSTASGFGSTVFSQTGLSGLSQTVTVTSNLRTYYWEVSATDGVNGSTPWAASWSFTTVPQAPGVPVLASPSNNAINQSASPTLSWNSSGGGAPSSYVLMISTASNFSTTVTSVSGITATSQAIGPLPAPPNYGYYWEVQSTNAGGTSAWSSVWSFSVTEDYTQWGSNTGITVNGGSNGANIGTTVTNFPVLIRLNSTNFAGWGSTQPGGADIRFSAGGAPATQLPYQIQRWNATNNLAEIWVQAPSIPASGTTPITMYWGNGGVFNMSNGPGVFNATAGYVAVWHLSDTTDARGLLPLSGATQPTTKVPGIFDSAYTFNSTSQFFKTPDSISSNSTALNFSSSTSFTLSGWERDTSAAVGGGDRMIVSKGGSTWNMGERGASTSNYEMMSAENGDWIWDTTLVRPTLGAWHHIVGVRSLTQGTSPIYAESLYVDGALSIPASAINSGAVTAVTTRAVDIGTQPDNPTDLWKGQLQEVEISNVIRTHDWVKLSYQNQQANQTVVTMNAYQPAAPSLSSPASGATGQTFSSLTLNWNSVSGTTSYGLMVSTSATFASTVTYLTGLTGTSQALPSLQSITTYYWQVFDVATGGTTGPGGTSAWAAAWSFTTNYATPGVPTLASPTSGATGQVISGLTLSWSSSAGGPLTSYQVQVSSTSGSFASTVWGGTGITGTSQVLPTTLASNTPYYWEVNATGPGGGSVWSSVSTFTTAALPGTPVLSLPTNNAQNQPIAGLVLNWSTASGTVTSYHVQVSLNDPTFASTVVDASPVGTQQALPDAHQRRHV